MSQFAPDALNRPLFLDHPDDLARKLNGASGLLRTYWDDFRQRCAADPEFRKDNIYLEAALGGPVAEEARDFLLAYQRALAQADTAGDVQFHTWCRAGNVSRRVVFFDWLASRGVWTAADREEAAEAYIGFAYKHCYMVLLGRSRTSNNQPISMVLNLLVTGFIFGYKHGNHPTARHLFHYGMGRLPDLIGLFAGDGYGGEGSTYTSHVNTPLSFWLAEFLRQVAGGSWLERQFAPNGGSLRNMVETELRIISPGGLLAPWDHYGWQRGVNCSAFAYLARLTDNPRYLNIIAHCKLWDDPGYLAWGKDDQLWTLVWWPPAARAHADGTLPGELFGWFLPRTGAALDADRLPSRLMQVWDHCSGSIAAIGRGQCNPNHLMLDVASEPVFMDGVPTKDTDPWNYDPEKVFGTMSKEARERFLFYLGSIQNTRTPDVKQVVKGIAPGLIGASNSIVMDDEDWYWPGRGVHGRAEFYGRTAGLQAVTSDSAIFYQPHFSATRVRRSSLWTSSDLGLVVDDLQASGPHTWRWQVYLRHGSTLAGERQVSIPLSHAPAVRLAWAEDPAVRLRQFPDYPKSVVGPEIPTGSTRLELEQRGPRARFAVLLAPGAKAASLRWLSDTTLEATVDGARHLFVVANLTGAPLTVGGHQTSAAMAWQSPAGQWAELAPATIPEPAKERGEVDDVEVELDFHGTALAELAEWTAPRTLPGASVLSQVDAVFAELKQATPDEPALLAALHSPRWPVAVAAALVIGARGLTSAAPELRRLLLAEHALPAAEIYPPEETKAGAKSYEDLGKRWRFKAALIIALGKLRDSAAVPLLYQIMADSRDYYIPYSVACQALGRIGGRDALAALAPAFTETETNTRCRANYAKAHIERQLAK